MEGLEMRRMAVVVERKEEEIRGEEDGQKLGSDATTEIFLVTNLGTFRLKMSAFAR